MSRWFTGLVCALVAFAAQAAAPTPESIERLMTVSRVDKMLDGIKPQMDNMMKAMTEQAGQGKKPTADEQKILDKFKARVIDLTTAELSMARMKSMFIDIYAANFTQEEVDGIIAFHETPVGQSMISKMPHVMQSVMADMPKRLAPMMEKMKQAGQEMAAEMQALHSKKK